MLNSNKHRTKKQNEELVCEILLALSRGDHIKQIASSYNIPLWTLTNLLSRYRRRHGFKSLYHMLAVFVIIRERQKNQCPTQV